MNWTINEEITVRDFLQDKLSKKLLKNIKSSGDILVNGVHQTVRYTLHPGDILEVIYPEEVCTILPYDHPLDIRYEDQYYIVLYKEKGMATIPTKKYPDNTVANALVSYFQKNNIHSTVHIVNRLDRDTRGLLLVAKDRHSHALLSSDIKQVHRVYRCVVEGKLEGEGMIDLPIGKVDTGTKRCIDYVNGKDARTHYKVLESYEDHSVVECILETGRTHQIRLHMASIGHPLIGDELYGMYNENSFDLESVKLSFVHPYTNNVIEITAK